MKPVVLILMPAVLVLAAIIATMAWQNVSLSRSVDEARAQTKEVFALAKTWKSLADQSEEFREKWREIAEASRDSFLVCNSLLPPDKRMAP